LFFNLGSFSQLTLQDLTLSDLAHPLEGWTVQHGGGFRFDVESSQRGRLTEQLPVDTEFVTEEGDVSFTIQEGSREASDTDRFHFVTASLRPYALSAAPVHMEILARTLWVVTKAPSMVAIDLDDFTLISETPLTITQPAQVTREGDMLLIADGQGQAVDQWDMDQGALVQTVMFDDLAPQTLHSVTKLNNFYYVMTQTSKQLYKWPVGEDSASDTLTFASQPTQMTSYEDDGTKFIVGFAQGEMELVNAVDFTRIDTDLGSDSDFRDKTFYDQGPTSSPELLSVTTFDDTTLTESWQLTFEALLPGTVLEAVIAGNTVTFSDVDLMALGGLNGDALYVQLEDENYEITNVGSTVVTLAQAPSTQGSAVVGLRAQNSYVVTGSSSGYQVNRLFNDEDYVSDQDQVALRVRSSLDEPATQGDFFSFRTIDDITPLRVSGRANVQGMVAFTKIGQDEPRAYVLLQSNAAVAEINLVDQSVASVIR
jgi:hypothetical protein